MPTINAVKSDILKLDIKIISNKKPTLNEYDDWVTNNIDVRDKEIVKEIQNTLTLWINDYGVDKRAEIKNQPTEEELRQIEEYLKKP